MRLKIDLSNRALSLRRGRSISLGTDSHGFDHTRQEPAHYFDRSKIDKQRCFAEPRRQTANNRNKPRVYLENDA